MFHILNWPILEVPVIIGWYLDESYGVMMPSNVWNKPVSDIDDKITMYSPRNMQGWDIACEDMLEHGLPKGRIISLRFWIEVGLRDAVVMIDSDDDEGIIKLMDRCGNPDVMIITGKLNNLMALLQYQTTWTNVLYNHGNIMPLMGNLFTYILLTLKDVEVSNFSKAKLKSYIDKIMEGEEGDRPVDALDPEHIKIIGRVVERLSRDKEF
jgi:hypothetical protein